MRLGPLSGVWHQHHGGFIHLGNLSLAILFNAEERGFRPLSERHGTGRSWTLGIFQLRYHGRIARRAS